MILLLLSTTLLIFSLFHLQKWFKRRILVRQMLQRFNSPPALPLLGHLTKFGYEPSKVVENITELVTTLPSPFRLTFGPTGFGFNVIVVDEPEHLKVILNSMDAIDRPFIVNFLGFPESLFEVRGERWRAQRKMLNPSFTQTSLNRFIDDFNRTAQTMVESMRKHAVSGETFDVSENMEIGSMDNVASTIFELEMDFNGDTGKKYLVAFREGLHLVFLRMLNFWHHPTWIYRWTRNYKIEQEHRKLLNDVAEEQLGEWLRRKEALRGSSLPAKASIWLDEIADVSLKTLVDHAVGLGFAAVETSATTMSFALLALAIEQEVQRKVFEEIQEVVKDTKNITPDMLSSLIYTEAVLKETMRAFGVVPYAIRSASADIELEKGLTVPSGSLILISLLSLHWRKDLWGPDARKFDPNRFMGKEKPFFIPFSIGPRNCIGTRYAWTFMKIAMIQLISTYEFSTDLKFEDFKLESTITTHNLLKYPVRIKTRIEKN